MQRAGHLDYAVVQLIRGVNRLPRMTNHRQYLPHQPLEGIPKVASHHESPHCVTSQQEIAHLDNVDHLD